jgi:hypothetical protein
MSVITVGIGFMILIAGRPVYPIFVGGMCFLLGALLDRSIDLTPVAWGPLAGPVIFAILGFLAAFALRRWAAWVAGFGAGVYLVYTLPQVFEAGPGWSTPLTFIIAGTFCVTLLLITFDAFLLFLSSLTAVTMILSNTRFGRLEPVVIFLILLVFGMITQYLVYEYARPAPD